MSYINKTKVNDTLEQSAIYQIDEDEELLNCSSNNNNSICLVKSSNNINYNFI